MLASAIADSYLSLYTPALFSKIPSAEAGTPDFPSHI